MTRNRHVAHLAGRLGILVVVMAATSAEAQITTVIEDPFTNTTTQHRTAVEPDTFAFGSTIVVAAQVGRNFAGGASGIAAASSTDGGTSWSSGALPGITNNDGNGESYDFVTDPAVAYDAKHDVWMVNSLGLTNPGLVGAAVLVNRSVDGGVTWESPVTVHAAVGKEDLDKTFLGCDNHIASPFYGNCYATFDNFGSNDQMLMSTSSDGGLTWTSPMAPVAMSGLGGQPVVQPDGSVIGPYGGSLGQAINVFRSTDGGMTWSKSVKIARATDHLVAGRLRSSDLPSSDVDAAGRVYVVWQDCRFRKSCSSNDLVLATSDDGVAWTAPRRIPIDSVDSGVDHFIPGLGVDPGTAGDHARLGLTYYFYPVANCGGRKASSPPCQLEAGYVQSADGGQTWTTPVVLAGPIDPAWLANTDQGRMVGDYVSTSWVDGNAFGAIAIANAPSAGVFDEPIAVPTGLNVTASLGRFSADDAQAVVSASSDHPRSTGPMRIR
jgi:hypothetical protein